MPKHNHRSVTEPPGRFQPIPNHATAYTPSLVLGKNRHWSQREGFPGRITAADLDGIKEYVPDHPAFPIGHQRKLGDKPRRLPQEPDDLALVPAAKGAVVDFGD